MDALTASSVKVFVENHQRQKDTVSWCPTRKDHLFPRAHLPYSGCPKWVHHRFALSFSLHRKSTVLPAASLSPESQIIVGDEEIQTQDASLSRTVRVKFQLKKDCAFGQQFLIVGDDPEFGIWDPANAVPMNWSDGHVWTVELDLPCDKIVKYKFILKGGSDAIYWQPGPDRMFQAWETTKTITVCEDWENAQLQTIIEEDYIADQLTESQMNSEIEILEDLLLQPGEDHVACVDANANCNTDPETFEFGEKRKLEVNTNGISSARITPNTHKYVTKGQNDVKNKRMSGHDQNLKNSKEGKFVDSGAGIPLLVPGLNTTVESEEPSEKELNEESEADVFLGTDRPEKFSVSEITLDKGQVTSLSNPEEETAMLSSDKPEHHDKGNIDISQLVQLNDEADNNEMGNTVLEKDIKWGQRTILNFLATVGLL